MKIFSSRKLQRELGDAARDVRDWPQAAHHYEAHLTSSPRDFAIWVQLGHALKECGRPIEALAAYSEAMALNLDDADLLLNVGRLYHALGHDSEALEFCVRSLNIDEKEHVRQEVEYLTRRVAEVSNFSALGDSNSDDDHANSIVREVPLNPVYFGPDNETVGYIESFQNSVLIGWAWNPAAPDVPVTVEFLVDGEMVGSVIAASYRKDVSVNGFGSGYSGFEFNLPPGCISRSESQIVGRVSGTDRELKGSPFFIDAELVNEASFEAVRATDGAYDANIGEDVSCHPQITVPDADHVSVPDDTVGYIESFQNSVLTGWAWNPASPNEPANVEFFIDGEIVGSVFATAYREDVSLNRFGSGLSGFEFRIPGGRSSPGRASVVGRLAGTDRELKGSPFMIDPEFVDQLPFDGELTNGVVANANNGGEVGSELKESQLGAAQIAAANDTVGYVERLEGSVLVGWAWNPASPGEPATVEIFVDGAFVGASLATDYREDVHLNKFGSGFAGFQFKIPIASISRQESHVVVRLSGTSHELKGSPFLVKHKLHGPTPDRASDAGSPLVGQIEGLLGAVLTGWAWNPTAPEQPASLEFVVDGRVIGVVDTTVPREDVRQLGFVSGIAGFKFKIPFESISTPKAHIVVRLAETNFELNGSPFMVDIEMLNQLFSDDMLAAISFSNQNANVLETIRLRAEARVNSLTEWKSPKSVVRALAFYLPQFHPFKENSEWWGPGFTEWTNVTRAKPLFEGHYQPRRPGELGYYDLRLPEVQERQVELARLMGVSGFCFYFYWFSGSILMEKPIWQFAKNVNIDFPFCLCWANENWTRRWDGLDSEILIKQDYSAKDDIDFISHISQYLIHENYIKVDGKPIILIYRIELFPEPTKTVERWRKYCRDSGVGEIYLACVMSFGWINPDEYGFDAAVQFPPNMSGVSEFAASEMGAGDDFRGRFHNYADSILIAAQFKWPDFKLLRGVYAGWDNSARRGLAATIFPNSLPHFYMKYLEEVVKQVQEGPLSADEKLVFVNAWNEWAEGTYLEPDEALGYAYGEATRVALIRASLFFKKNAGTVVALGKGKARAVVIVHAYYPEILEELIPWFNVYRSNCDFVFTTPQEKIDTLESQLSSFRGNYRIIETPNRGRDVAPFLRVLNEIRASGYRYVLKLHTKKSPHRQDGRAWRDQMFRAIAAPERFAEILDSMDVEPGIGIVGADEAIVPMSTYIGSNTHHIGILSRRMGVGLSSLRNLSFVAGTMFVARIDAFDLLMGLSIGLDDFEAEAGQLDGTLAHAIERMISVSASEAALRVVGVAQLLGIESAVGSSSELTFQYAEPTAEQFRPF